MQSVMPPGDPAFTVIAGKGQGYLGLAINYTTVHDTGLKRDCPAMVTAWEPTPDELAKLNKGAKVIVSILGVPPINPMMLNVGEEPT